MSKVIMSLPDGLVKRSVVGGAVAVAVYVGMQLLWALLLHREVMGEELLYPAVCVSAALASLLGCGYSVVKGKGASMLSVPAVVAVFLAVTLAAAFLTADAISVGTGLTGVGLSMAAGGLLAALVGPALCRRGQRRPGRKRRRP